MAKPTTIRRETVAKKRLKRMALQATTAANCIGKIEKNCEIFGLTKGNFSLISILEHLIDQTGPADIVLSTWTAAAVDIQAAEKFLENKRIKSIQFLVDQSFRTRQAEYCARLVKAFGKEAIRFSCSHCKFVTITNENWNLVVRTSMNLNENRRIENFEISDDKDFSDFLLELRNELFDQPFEFTQENFHRLGNGNTVSPVSVFDRLRAMA